MTRADLRVAWRTYHGLTVDSAPVWNRAEALSYAWEHAPWFPTCAAWLVVDGRDVEQLTEPLREWGPLRAELDAVAEAREAPPGAA